MTWMKLWTTCHDCDYYIWLVHYYSVCTLSTCYLAGETPQTSKWQYRDHPVRQLLLKLGFDGRTMIVMPGSHAPPPASGTWAPLCFPSLKPKHHITASLTVCTGFTGRRDRAACDTVRGPGQHWSSWCWWWHWWRRRRCCCGASLDLLLLLLLCSLTAAAAAAACSSSQLVPRPAPAPLCTQLPALKFIIVTIVPIISKHG